MKLTIQIYTWLTALVFLGFGCSDFLKEYSMDQVYAASCEDLNEVLIGNAYMKSSTQWQFSVSSPSESIYYPWLFVMDDDVDELIVTTDAAIKFNSTITFLRNFYTWQAEPFFAINANRNEIKDATFEKLYQHIGYVNVIIDYVDEFPEDPIEDRMRIRGEGQFLRGAYYLMLNNLYGLAYDANNAKTDLGVPLNLTEYVEEKYFSRASVQEVYNVIVRDLKGACENLKGVKQKNFYRANELATNILLSRVYLYMGDYANVIAQCDSALRQGCPLLDLNTFRVSDNMKARDFILDEANPEIVFTMGSSIATTLFARKTGVGDCNYCVSNTLAELYNLSDEIEDLRWECYYTGHATAMGSFVPLKIGADKTLKVFEAFVIRTIEAYLNKAEAQAMMGDIAGAIATLQPVLNTRYAAGKQPQLASLGEENLVTFIRDERRRELCFEGHRWQDLKRYAVAPKYPVKSEIRHTIYSPRDRTGGNYAGYFILKPYGEDGGWILPYPKEEIIYNNGSLENTPRPERENADESYRTE